jgi:hypothetical protein
MALLWLSDEAWVAIEPHRSGSTCASAAVELGPLGL